MTEKSEIAQAEFSVLGALLLDASRATTAQVLTILTAEDFSVARHRAIYAAIQDLWGDSSAIDEITVVAKLASRGELGIAGGAAYVATVAAATPTSANAEHWAQLVRTASISRKLYTITDATAVKARDGEDPFGLIDSTARALAELTRQHATTGAVPIKTALRESYHALKERMESPRLVTGVDTGFADLNELTCGWQPTDLIVIAGRPSMGKTALALESARLSGKRVHCASLEMGRQQVTYRMLSALTRIDGNRLRTGKLGQHEWQRLTTAMGELAKIDMHVDDTGAQTLEHLHTEARKLYHNGGLDLIVVDYLQLMRGPPRSGNREQEIATLSRGLKALAKELNVPVIAISQLSRAVEMREDKRPQLGDLRESGAIEQDADLVIFVYRDDYYNPQSLDVGTAEIIVRKHRNGPVGTVRLKFFQCYAKFTDLERRF